MATGKIKTLFSDKEKTEALFPRTKTSAVSNSEGKGLDAILENLPYFSDADSSKVANVPLNADTLGGHPVSDFALAYDVENLTYEDVGAAPAGYGLGEGAGNTLTTLAQLDAIKVNSFNNYKGEALPVERAYSSEVSQGGVLTIYCQEMSTQYFFLRYPSRGSVLRRFTDADGSVWGEWEWVNPPMRAGVEFRTIERWNDKPVYTKLIDCYNLPDIGTEKTVTHNTGGKMIAITGHLSTGDVLPYINDVTEIKLSTTPKNIIIQTVNWGFSSEKLVTEVTATVRIWYIKD